MYTLWKMGLARWSLSLLLGCHLFRCELLVSGKVYKFKPMDVVFKFPLKKDISLATMPGNSSLKTYWDPNGCAKWRWTPWLVKNHQLNKSMSWAKARKSCQINSGNHAWAPTGWSLAHRWGKHPTRSSFSNMKRIQIAKIWKCHNFAIRNKRFHKESPPFEFYKSVLKDGFCSSRTLLGSIQRLTSFKSFLWQLKTTISRWFKLTFLYAIWRSLNLWRGHLNIPKSAQRIATFIRIVYHLWLVPHSK